MSPFVRLGCNKNHFAHYLCLLKCLTVAWHKKRMIFNFLRCPGCKKPLGVKGNSKVVKLYDKHLKMREKVMRLVIDQLKLNLSEHNKILKDQSHRFFKKPKSYALAIFAVYPCHKCKQPFIGGKVSCE